MLLHGKIESSEVNGPGNRAVIWFQGCTLNCAGCWNPDTHKFDASRIVSNQEIRNWLLALEGIEGITFSGGEPMQHVADVIDIAEFVKDVLPDLSVGMFTGYTQRELEKGHWHTLLPGVGALIPGDGELWARVAKSLDFAVMGRFNASKVTTTKPLCGSSNQDIVMFSDRYGAKDFKPQSIQVTVSLNDDNAGLVKITGYPGVEFMKNVRAAL